jgi:hypothetical protein
MSENEMRLEQVEQKLIRLKKTPFMQKANAAESIIEETVYLMRCMVADIEDLKNGK